MYVKKIPKDERWYGFEGAYIALYGTKKQCKANNELFTFCISTFQRMTGIKLKDNEVAEIEVKRIS